MGVGSLRSDRRTVTNAGDSVEWRAHPPSGWKWSASSPVVTTSVSISSGRVSGALGHGHGHSRTTYLEHDVVRFLQAWLDSKYATNARKSLAEQLAGILLKGTDHRDGRTVHARDEHEHPRTGLGERRRSPGRAETVPEPGTPESVREYVWPGRTARIVHWSSGAVPTRLTTTW